MLKLNEERFIKARGCFDVMVLTFFAGVLEYVPILFVEVEQLAGFCPPSVLQLAHYVFSCVRCSFNVRLLREARERNPLKLVLT